MEVSAPDTEIYLDTLDGNFGQEVEMEVEEEELKEEDSAWNQAQVRTTRLFLSFNLPLLVDVEFQDSSHD